MTTQAAGVLQSVLNPLMLLWAECCGFAAIPFALFLQVKNRSNYNQITTGGPPFMIPPGRSLEARVDAIADAMGERVAERLIAVFRELPNTPIYSRPQGRIRALSPDRWPRAITRGATLPRARDADLLPASAVGKDACAQSIRAFCVEGGWKRRTFYYRRGRSLDRVATFLHEQRAGKTPNAAKTLSQCPSSQIISVPVTMSKTPPIPPLFKADTATLAFSASKDGKLTVNYQNWDSSKVVLEGQVFEVRCGPQGVEGRIVEGGRGGLAIDDPTPLGGGGARALAGVTVTQERAARGARHR